mmetsp:Transcript_9661/g.21424  ORF Transcript_9661/g.21424 Transcript_9661/m.21424 type:complete len:267 (-) Transcript_9661:116-916(-)
MSLCLYVCVSVYVCLYVSASVCLCVCVYERLTGEPLDGVHHGGAAPLAVLYGHRLFEGGQQVLLAGALDGAGDGVAQGDGLGELQLQRSHHRHAASSDASQRVRDALRLHHLEEEQRLAAQQLCAGDLQHVRHPIVVVVLLVILLVLLHHVLGLLQQHLHTFQSACVPAHVPGLHRSDGGDEGAAEEAQHEADECRDQQHRLVALDGDPEGVGLGVQVQHDGHHQLHEVHDLDHVRRGLLHVRLYLLWRVVYSETHVLQDELLRGR